mgnify:CR=1 FL=1
MLTIINYNYLKIIRFKNICILHTGMLFVENRSHDFVHVITAIALVSTMHNFYGFIENGQVRARQIHKPNSWG